MACTDQCSAFADYHNCVRLLSCRLPGTPSSPPFRQDCLPRINSDEEGSAQRGYDALCEPSFVKMLLRCTSCISNTDQGHTRIDGTVLLRRSSDSLAQIACSMIQRVGQCLHNRARRQPNSPLLRQGNCRCLVLSLGLRHRRRYFRLQGLGCWPASSRQWAWTPFYRWTGTPRLLRERFEKQESVKSLARPSAMVSIPFLPPSRASDHGVSFNRCNTIHE